MFGTPVDGANILAALLSLIEDMVHGEYFSHSTTDDDEGKGEEEEEGGEDEEEDGFAEEEETGNVEEETVVSVEDGEATGSKEGG